jgi:hypothetical protein
MQIEWIKCEIGKRWAVIGGWWTVREIFQRNEGATVLNVKMEGLVSKVDFGG